VRVLAVIVSLALAAVLPAAAQSAATSQASQPTLFRSGASLVALNVTVTGPDKRFVAGLALNDFAVYEDGIQQDLQFFESNAVPVDLIVLIDASSSMRHRLDIVHQAALGFINTLRPGDRGAVVAFNDNVSVVQGLTGDRALLESAVKGIVANGGTALNNAIYVALKQFGRSARDTSQIRRQALAVLSDGNDTASLLSFDDVLEVAHKSGVTVYPIALASDFEPQPAGTRGFSQSQYSMRKLAQETGAQAFFPLKVHELPAIYAAIAQELSYQYSIGYSPRDPRPDGRFRRIDVRVTTRPELKPRARTGYIAAANSVAAVQQGDIREP
jgi:Ca-activated chloride channel family protein